MAGYQALPLCAPQQPAESLPEYAARVLRHLLATDCTATLTDHQLEMAEMAAARACAQVQGREEAERTVAILSAARHTIALIQRFRRTLDAEEALKSATTLSSQAPPAFPQGGNQGGRPAPILPPPPPQLPPAGQIRNQDSRLEIRF